MALMHHDTTGTQTDSARPLSRKNLKRLMPKNIDDLTSGALMNTKNPFHIADRKQGRKLWTKMGKKREERSRLRRQYRKITLDDGTTAQLIPTPAEVEMMKPTIFERLGGMFGNLRKKFEREKARGK